MGDRISDKDLVELIRQDEQGKLRFLLKNDPQFIQWKCAGDHIPPATPKIRHRIEPVYKGYNLAHVCCATGGRECLLMIFDPEVCPNVEKLLHEIAPNVGSGPGTPLIAAIRNGQDEVVRELLPEKDPDKYGLMTLEGKRAPGDKLHAKVIAGSVKMKSNSGDGRWRSMGKYVEDHFKRWEELREKEREAARKAAAEKAAEEEEAHREAREKERAEIDKKNLAASIAAGREASEKEQRRREAAEAEQRRKAEEAAKAERAAALAEKERRDAEEAEKRRLEIQAAENEANKRTAEEEEKQINEMINNSILGRRVFHHNLERELRLYRGDVGHKLSIKLTLFDVSAEALKTAALHAAVSAHFSEALRVRVKPVNKKAFGQALVVVEVDICFGEDPSVPQAAAAALRDGAEGKVHQFRDGTAAFIAASKWLQQESEARLRFVEDSDVSFDIADKVEVRDAAALVEALEAHSNNEVARFSFEEWSQLGDVSLKWDSFVIAGGKCWVPHDTHAPNEKKAITILRARPLLPLLKREEKDATYCLVDRDGADLRESRGIVNNPNARERSFGGDFDLDCDGSRTRYHGMSSIFVDDDDELDLGASRLYKEVGGTILHGIRAGQNVTLLCFGYGRGAGKTYSLQRPLDRKDITKEKIDLKTKEKTDEADPTEKEEPFPGLALRLGADLIACSHVLQLERARENAKKAASERETLSVQVKMSVVVCYQNVLYDLLTPGETKGGKGGKQPDELRPLALGSADNERGMWFKEGEGPVEGVIDENADPKKASKVEGPNTTLHFLRRAGTNRKSLAVALEKSLAKKSKKAEDIMSDKRLGRSSMIIIFQVVQELEGPGGKSAVKSTVTLLEVGAPTVAEKPEGGSARTARDGPTRAKSDEALRAKSAPAKAPGDKKARNNGPAKGTQQEEISLNVDLTLLKDVRARPLPQFPLPCLARHEAVPLPSLDVAGDKSARRGSQAPLE